MSYKFTIKGKLVFIDPAAEYDGAFDLPRAVYDELRELGFKVEA